MRRIFVILFIILTLPATSASAMMDRPASLDTVFEITSADQSVWEKMTAYVQKTREALGPSIYIEIVAHQEAVAFLKTAHNGNTPLLHDLQKQNVFILACQKSMRENGVKEDALTPFAKIIPSGAEHVAARQESMWLYTHWPAD